MCTLRVRYMATVGSSHWACWVCSSLCHVWAAAATISRNTHTHTHTHTHTNGHMHTHTHTHINIYPRPVSHSDVKKSTLTRFVLTKIFLLWYVHMYVCVCVYVCVSLYCRHNQGITHTHIHTHTHTDRESGQCADLSKPFLNVYCSVQLEERGGWTLSYVPTSCSLCYVRSMHAHFKKHNEETAKYYETHLIIQTFGINELKNTLKQLQQ